MVQVRKQGAGEALTAQSLHLSGFANIRPPIGLLNAGMLHRTPAAMPRFVRVGFSPAHPTAASVQPAAGKGVVMRFKQDDASISLTNVTVTIMTQTLKNKNQNKMEGNSTGVKTQIPS